MLHLINEAISSANETDHEFGYLHFGLFCLELELDVLLSQTEIRLLQGLLLLYQSGIGVLQSSVALLPRGPQS